MKPPADSETEPDIAGARTLLQRALRTLPKCQELYLEYCRMELMYREKIRKRMELMGIDQAALKAKSTSGIDLSLVPMKPVGEEEDQDQQPEEEDDGMKELLDLPEGDPAAEEAAKTKPLPAFITSSSNPFFEGAIVLVVFHAAIAKIPSDVSFRQQMLSVVQAFPDTKKIQDEIYSSLERDFPENEDVLLLIARRPVDSLPVDKKKDHDAVFNATREALDNIDNELLVRTLRTSAARK
jgi:U3 small nucleolar RNA-associated protein 6